MINVIRKTPDPNGIYYYVQLVRPTDYPSDTWEHTPDISEVSDVPKKYWKYNGTNIVAEMSQTEKDSVDASQVVTHYEMEQPNLLNVQNSGRFYCFADQRQWVTDSDDNYGPNHIQFQERGGKGLLPINEWEHQGYIVSKGDIVRKLIISGRNTNIEVEDMEYALVCKTPVNSNWDSGIKSDGNIQSDYIIRDYFMNPETSLGGKSLTGLIDRIHRQTIHLNFEVPEDGFITLWLRPKVEPSRNSYFIATYKIEIVAVT